MTSVFYILLGLLTLFFGGDVLIRGASRLAAMLGMTPLMIGLTVVSFGTSAPELAVCVDAVRSSNAEIAVGNIVGSNISNILLILGLTAVILPLAVAQQLVRFDIPVMISAATLFFILASDGSLSRNDGAVLLLAMFSYIGVLIWLSQREKKANAEKQDGSSSPKKSSAKDWAINLGLVLLGLVMLGFGGSWLVKGAVEIASSMGVSKLVIGLTIVAIGSSAPEVVTSVVAAMRGRGDMAAGNVIGSNIANLLLIGGAASVVAPAAVPAPSAAIDFDLPVMIAASVACLPIFFTGLKIERWEGFLFLGYFFAYMTYVLLNAAGHDALPAYSWVMWVFVLPLTLVTLVVLTIRSGVQSLAKRH